MSFNHGPVQLKGFDGHEDQLGIARWIVERMGEFQRIKDRIVDCHCNVRAEYAAMLRAFKPLRVKLNYGQEGLTADDIIAVMTAPRREREAPEAPAQSVTDHRTGPATDDELPVRSIEPAAPHRSRLARGPWPLARRCARGQTPAYLSTSGSP